MVKYTKVLLLCLGMPFYKKPSKHNYAFIDSQNLNVGVQKFGWKMDWKKFRKFLKDKYNVEKAYMFIGYVPEFESLYEQLHESGYLVVLKPTYDMTRPQPETSRTRLDEMQGEGEKRSKPYHEYGARVSETSTQQLAKSDGRVSGSATEQDSTARPTKGNVDADLVLWAMKELPNYNKAVIVSGDGDFYSLIEYLDEKKKLMKLLAPNAHYSGLYNKYENYIVRLDTMRKELSYRDYKRR